MKTKYVYKVVAQHKVKVNVYTSCSINDGPFFLTYKIGKKTTAPRPDAGIFVFRTKKAAKTWNSMQLCLRCRYGKEIPLVWKDFKEVIACRNLASWKRKPLLTGVPKPQGTIAVDWVIPEAVI